MTLQDFTTEQLQDMKQACLDTRQQYIDKNTTNDCPLCTFDDTYGKRDCSICPWELFINTSCGVYLNNFSKELFNLYFFRLKMGIHQEWSEKRIKELTEWADAIQQEIDRRF